MRNPSRRRLIGGVGKGQTVTVIEAPVLQNQRRKALVTFWVTLTITGLLAGTVASHYMHPILGILTGAALGFFLGVVLGFLVLAWPVLRMIWWWLPEVILGGSLIYGWVWLMTSTPLWLSLVLVAGLGAVMLIRAPRQAVLSVFWCLAVRHRLRTCFSAFVSRNRQGTLPFILPARPTPAGERVWVWLRPGLALHDLEQEGQLQRLAVACWANEVRVTRASRRYAALIRLDITRRDTLTDSVMSNLPDHVPDDMPATAPVSPAVPPIGVNLADVPAPRSRRSPDNNENRPRRGRKPDPSPVDDFDAEDYA